MIQQLFKKIGWVIAKPKIVIPDIETLVNNREAFDAFVYTPVRETLIELK